MTLYIYIPSLDGRGLRGGCLYLIFTPIPTFPRQGGRGIIIGIAAPLTGLAMTGDYNY